MRVLTSKKLNILLHDSYIRGLNVGYTVHKRMIATGTRGIITSARIEEQVGEILRKEGF